MELSPKKKVKEMTLSWTGSKAQLAGKINVRSFVSWPWREEIESHLHENFEVSLEKLNALEKILIH